MDSAEETAARAERQRATQAYRRSVRNTGVAIVVGVAAVFALSALLPATTQQDRVGLLVSAGLALVTGFIWYAVIPHAWFAGLRVFAACTVATAVLLVLVVLTGGAQSLYVGYLVIPAVVLILEGSLGQMLLLATLIGAGVAVIAAISAAGGVPLGEGAPARLLLLATVVGACAAVARVTGRQRVVSVERAAGLAQEGERARSMAMTDPVTGLLNRRALDQELEGCVSDALRTGVPFSAIAIELDGLKRVNDELGHDAGDVLLRSFARAIHQAIRGGDVGLRIGGDEFLILLPRTNEMSARTVAERLEESAPTVASFLYGIGTHRQGEPGGQVLLTAHTALTTAKGVRRVGAG